MIWFGLTALACTPSNRPVDTDDDGGGGTTDTQPDTTPDDSGTETNQGCDEIEFDFDGPNPPHVGDEWTVWFRCDGAVTMGAAIIRITPPEMAAIFDNELTFLESGKGEVKIQSGTYVVTQDVSVLAKE